MIQARAVHTATALPDGGSWSPADSTLRATPWPRQSCLPPAAGRSPWPRPADPPECVRERGAVGAWPAARDDSV